MMKNYTILMDNFKDELGKYEVKFANSKVTLKGIEYIYHSSGLCRIVYISPDKKFVLKIPNLDLYDDSKYELRPDGSNWWELPWSVRHNILEARAYEQCPKQYRKFLAKTKLLKYGWVKQEFVEVFDVNYTHKLRELGRRKNGSVCLFDFDPLIDHDDSFDTHFKNEQQFERLATLIKQLS